MSMLSEFNLYNSNENAENLHTQFIQLLLLYECQRQVVERRLCFDCESLNGNISAVNKTWTLNVRTNQRITDGDVEMENYSTNESPGC